MHTVSGPCAYSPAFPSLTPLQPCWPLWCAFYMPGKLLTQSFYPCHCCFVECVFLVILTGISLTSFKSLINCCIISKVLYVKLTALLLIIQPLPLSYRAFPIFFPCFIFLLALTTIWHTIFSIIMCSLYERVVSIHQNVQHKKVESFTF